MMVKGSHRTAARIITSINQKGGVGKTTSACNIAFAAAERGCKVLFVDFDTQGNGSQFLSGDLDINRRRGGAELLFTSESWEPSKSLDGKIDILHGHQFLEEMDHDREGLLRQAIDMRQAVRALPYDYIVFDTPPSISPRHVAPLFWSDTALIAVQPVRTAMTGLKDIFSTIQQAMEINPDMAVRLMINLYTASSSSQRAVVEQLQEQFGEAVIGVFTSRVAVSDALAEFRPVWRYSRDKKLNALWLGFANAVLDTNS